MHFLQDEMLYHIQNKLEFSDDDDLVAINELCATLEAIIAIKAHAYGLNPDTNTEQGLFIKYPRIDQLIQGLFTVFNEQLNYLTFLNHVESKESNISAIFDYDMLKDTLSKIL